MSVMPVGELVFEKDGHEHHTPANQLSRGRLQKEAVGIHGASEEWSVIFTLRSVFGDFAWLVTYTVGDRGLSVEDSEIVKRPEGVELIQDVSFKPV